MVLEIANIHRKMAVTEGGVKEGVQLIILSGSTQSSSLTS